MDISTFDTIARTVSSSMTRRSALRALFASTAAAVAGGVLLQAEDTDARRKKGKKGKKKASPITCSDGLRNGSETDIDCGGPTCPRCGNGRTCARNTDCSTSRCGDGLGAGTVCRSCSSDGVCGSDANGGCRCHNDTGVCLSDVEPQLVATCSLCPQGTACIDFFEGPGCMPLCGG